MWSWIVFNLNNFACKINKILSKFFIYFIETFSQKKRGGSDNSCEEGHIGPLCGDCEATYSKLGDTCVTCMDPLVNLIRLIMALILYLAFIGLYIA